MKNQSFSVECASLISASRKIRRIRTITICLLLILPLYPRIAFTQAAGPLSINALQFDGINDYVSLGYVNYNLGSFDFSIEGWFRDQALAGTNSEEVILSNQPATSNNGIRVEILNGQLTLFLGSSSFTSISADLRDNACHHMAVTRQSGVIKLYLDGNVLSPLHSSQNSIDSPDPMLIGIRRSSAGLTGSFKGLLKEVRFWGSACSQMQIQFYMNSVPDPEVNLELMGYWRFAEGSGQNISCCQGNVSPGGFLGASAALESADPVWATGCPSCLAPTAYITSSSPVLCQGGSATLTANTSTGISFQWSLNGSTIAGATNSTYVATATGNYSVHVSSSCGSTNPAYNLVAGTLPSAVISTNNATTFCQGGTAVLNANNAAVTYQWRRNGLAIGGATGNSFTATTSGAYTCTETNTCGSSNSNTITITVNTIPAMPGIISGPSSVCKKQTKTYSISPVSGANSYTWSVPQGAQVQSGQGTTSLTVKFGNQSGNISVKAANQCGIGPTRTLAVSINCREMEPEAMLPEIFPNPSASNFNFHATMEGSSDLFVYDMTGNQVEAIKNILSGESKEFGANYPAGIYMLVIISGSAGTQKIRLVKQ